MEKKHDLRLLRRSVELENAMVAGADGGRATSTATVAGVGRCSTSNRRCLTTDAAKDGGPAPARPFTNSDHQRSTVDLAWVFTGWYFRNCHDDDQSSADALG
ncbi:uncharacterized protein G2W53_040146 [Senna tora]|uniref:Uncharacterized protein n=1 Tax=Senna tora TaxID=362788 RepID=A0A834SNZ2_9FABA|nr:uncharacterized protein G2W53_040146 [Senna tora]